MWYSTQRGKARPTLYGWVGTPASHPSLQMSESNKKKTTRWLRRLAGRRSRRHGAAKWYTSLPASAKGVLHRSWVLQQRTREGSQHEILPNLLENIQWETPSYLLRWWCGSRHRHTWFHSVSPNEGKNAKTVVTWRRCRLCEEIS